MNTDTKVIETVWFDLAEASAYLKRTPRALYNLVHKGKIPHHKHIGRLRFSKADLEKSLLSSKVECLFNGDSND